MSSLLPALTLCVLTGCASADRLCDMRIDYTPTTPVAAHGEVLLQWDFGVKLSRADRYGETPCRMTAIGEVCHASFVAQPPTWDDVCAMARVGHEVMHAMGAGHLAPVAIDPIYLQVTR